MQQRPLAPPPPPPAGHPPLVVTSCKRERKGLVEVDENEPKLRCMQGPRVARSRTKDHLIIDNEGGECIQGHVYWS